MTHPGLSQGCYSPDIMGLQQSLRVLLKVTLAAAKVVLMLSECHWMERGVGLSGYCTACVNGWSTLSWTIWL